MTLTEITYTMTRRDADGQEIDRKEERVYLRMRTETAESAKAGKVPLELSLTMQHIAELQGYSYAGITDITY